MVRNSRKSAAKPKGGRFGNNDLIRNYRPKEDVALLAFVIQMLPEKSRSELKSLLAHRHIAINGKPVTQFDTPVHPTDEVNINFDRPFYFFKHPQLRIVFEDDNIIVVEKAAGLLTIATDSVKEKTAYHILSEYVKKKDIRNKIFVVHRLDRDTSGLLMFAKSIKVQSLLQSDWDNVVSDRRYVAVVEGVMEKDEGELRSYLAENSAMNVYSTDEAHGKLAITRYRTLGRKGHHSLVELELETGRKNQIRVHLSELGFPIVGDRKYGAHGNPMGRLMLHANRLNFTHPITKEAMIFETPIPVKFKQMMTQL